MQKITPHLWFDTQAKEAAEFYSTTFPDSKIETVNVLHNTPSGDTHTVSMQIMGVEFAMISAGPYFKLNPSISFLVSCQSKEEVQSIWDKISVGGMALMELGAYPFSEWYGWIQDKFGVSWQIMFMGERPVTQRVIPTIMFVGANCGKAEEAVQFYASVFHESSIGEAMRYQKGEEPDKEGTIKHMQFVLEGLRFAIMDSAHDHQFALNEATSLIVYCQTQEEIDYYWEKLSANPESEQCGWLKDKFGLSWQITPVALQKMLEDSNPAKVEAVTQSFLKMKKFELAALQSAFDSVA